jgi:hypothetical protein
MTETKRSLLSAAGGLFLTAILTIASFLTESERARCILSWPVCLLYHWLGIHDPEGQEGTPADGIIMVFCFLVGSVIAITIYSFLTFFVLCLTTKDEN